MPLPNRGRCFDPFPAASKHVGFDLVPPACKGTVRWRFRISTRRPLKPWQPIPRLLGISVAAGAGHGRSLERQYLIAIIDSESAFALTESDLVCGLR